MFERKGSLEVTHVYKDFAECRSDWQGFNRAASTELKNFEYDPDNFLY
jgi:hypothetical protein